MRFAQAGTSRRGLVLFRVRTRAAARNGSGASPSRETAICVRCSSSAPGRHPLRRAAWHPTAVAGAVVGAPHDKGRCGGACQQDGADGLGDHDQRRTISGTGTADRIEFRRSAPNKAWEGQTGGNATSRSIPGNGKTHLRQCASSACFWSGPGSAEGIMASGPSAPHQQVEHMAAPTKAAPLQETPCQRRASTHGAKRVIAQRPVPAQVDI